MHVNHYCKQQKRGVYKYFIANQLYERHKKRKKSRAYRVVFINSSRKGQRTEKKEIWCDGKTVPPITSAEQHEQQCMSNNISMVTQRCGCVVRVLAHFMARRCILLDKGL